MREVDAAKGPPPWLSSEAESAQTFSPKADTWLRTQMPPPGPP